MGKVAEKITWGLQRSKLSRCPNCCWISSVKEASVDGLLTISLGGGTKEELTLNVYRCTDCDLIFAVEKEKQSE